ncbi:hypothetical protein AG1IA_05511 [Rhizoctonia solani AG-1 IA]|uniref:Uncharacterized protein n=1 Tax=Thanatephorus cucumeris (strain AG1-IA) TaxID=983506 RepID=L8WR12_THACA|nr:hypothetical protein AG1IA_05511 [Rhizoctonia solani AG-1 IA]
MINEETSPLTITQPPETEVILPLRVVGEIEDWVFEVRESAFIFIPGAISSLYSRYDG